MKQLNERQLPPEVLKVIKMFNAKVVKIEEKKESEESPVEEKSVGASSYFWAPKGHPWKPLNS